MKKFFFLFAIFTFLLPYTIFANQRVILDDVFFQPVNPLLIINERLMVPLREFGEAMGAVVNWQEANREITILRDGRYSVLHIDNAMITYGDFAVLQGVITFVTRNNSIMESPATLVNGVTYIPLRAVSQSLGATVEWDPVTSTATINSVIPPEEEPESGISDDLPDNYGDFTNISHFWIISSREAQARFYDSNANPFVLVVYNSEEHPSRLFVPNIQDIAQELGYRVFALDRSQDINNEQENTWMWNFIRQAALTEPAIFFVHSRTNVEIVLIDRHNIDHVETRIQNFRTIIETGGIQAGDFRNTSWFTNISSMQALQMYDRNEEFVLVLYNARHQPSHFYVPLIKAAARDVGHRVYAVDLDTHVLFMNHLEFVPGINTHLVNRLPMVVLVYSEHSRNNIVVYDRPDRLETAASIIEEFLRNTYNRTAANVRDLHHSLFRNSSAESVADMIWRGDNIMIVVYDTGVSSNLAIAQEIMDAVIFSGETVYAVNLSSDEFTHRELWWLRDAVGNVSPRNPVLLHYNARVLREEPEHVTSISGAGRTTLEFVARVFW